jgi:Cd(II)/Pb(II)-responsive transcriptional regulator
MRIGELATAAGLEVETVRYYEKAGLLPAPARRDNNYRRYDDTALQRVTFIRNCRALDMSLDEVRILLRFIDRPGGDCSPVDALVAEHLGHVRRRLAGLRQLERQLVLLQQACGHAKPQRCAASCWRSAARKRRPPSRCACCTGVDAENRRLPAFSSSAVPSAGASPSGS